MPCFQDIAYQMGSFMPSTCSLLGFWFYTGKSRRRTGSNTHAGRRAQKKPRRANVQRGKGKTVVNRDSIDQSVQKCAKVRTKTFCRFLANKRARRQSDGNSLEKVDQKELGRVQRRFSGTKAAQPRLKLGCQTGQIPVLEIVQPGRRGDAPTTHTSDPVLSSTTLHT